MAYKMNMCHVCLKLKAYVKSLSDSELCLAPRGSRVWSPRLFEMIWFGCVPVIIATGTPGKGLSHVYI